MKTQKRALSLLLAALLTLALAACGPAAATSPTAAPATEAPATAAPATDVPAAADAATAAPAAADKLAFSTTDLDGNAWTEADIAGNSLTMINFWEYWCGPCVGEMPELAKLYENYKDKGFVILGVFSDNSDLASVRSAVKNAGAAYPILQYTSDFDRFQTGFVPTTIFVNADGQVVGDTVVGAKSYDEWAAIIEGLL